MNKYMGNTSRRQFITSIAAMGAGAMLPLGAPFAQTPIAGAKSRRIDVHYHILPQRYFANDRARGGLMFPLTNIGMSQDRIQALVDRFAPARAVEELDRNGIATAISSIIAGGVWFGDVPLGRRLAREWNEDATQLGRDHPGRFGVFATLPLPDTDGSLKEIEYAVDTLKADGIGLLTTYDDKWLGDPSFAPVFEELNRRKAVVFVHPTAPLCCRTLKTGTPAFFLEVPTDTARTITSLIFTGTLRRFPEIRFIFSHAGGTIMAVAGRITGLAQNASAALANIPNGMEAELAKLYYDTAGAADAAAIGALRSIVPTPHILFGSDYPFVPIQETTGGLTKLGIAATDLQAIERDNAQALFSRWQGKL